MDQDSIREFLEKRSRGEVKDDFLPPITPRVEQKIEIQKKRPKSRLKRIAWALMCILFIVAFSYFGLSVYKKFKIVELDDSKNIMENVSKLTEIDISETPKIVTVTNADSIRGQAFFREAVNGDNLLIFETSKKAILYRPSTNKIISIAPLN